MRKVGLNPKGGNPETLKKIINEYGLDTTRLDQNRKNLYATCAITTHNKTKTSLEDIFNGLRPNYSTALLLKRLVEEGYKEMKCEICGIDSWLGRKISLQLHHKDGKRINNSLENLQILCPNCHSQTDSYAGKNVKHNP